LCGGEFCYGREMDKQDKLWGLDCARHLSVCRFAVLMNAILANLVDVALATTRVRLLDGSDRLRLHAVALLALKDEGNRFVPRPYDADQHGTIRNKGVAFESYRAGLRGRHLQDVVIPLSLTFEV